jgi:Ca2+-dependent lipid-binding protein
MPYYKSPQRLEGAGPNVEFSASRPYWINSYFIPPIDAGNGISLTVLSDRAGRTDVLLAFYDQDRQTVVGPPLASAVFAPDQKGLVVFARVERSGPYLLTITSYNSTYTFYVTSVWSPFYGLRNLTIYSFLLIPLGVVLVYYDEIVEKRERMIEEALREIRNRKRLEQLRAT